ncbi:hypothetical protein ESCO_005589 [Escovopsis weberi]|uniref:Uncharacterized protein n=1 Tax=Escovopsis weberi TaxID=150374 RepID=A0A0M8N4T8_ESCWE|nr:hypothetical protein ESCO_005589 [Escovopsis weberi]
MAAAIPDFDAVLVPMQLEAFVLNPAVCGTGAEDDTTARISPITQPNYTFLRLDKFLLQSDLQLHTDLHNTAPAAVNPRMTDLGVRPTPLPLRHRHGVYVHWILPRFYRAGVTAGSDVSKQRRREERSRRGLKTAPGSAEDDGSNDSPEFVQPATRWIVVRELDVDSVKPVEAKESFKDRKYEAWVVESDFEWSLEDIPLSMDLQTDLAPFVKGHAGGDVNIDQQAEVFIGRKTPLGKWTGQEDLSSTPPNISLMMSGNQLFADFQMHNSNVFSVLDNFQYGSDDFPQYLDYAKASYYVLGWHWREDVDPLWTSGEKNTHGASLEGLFMNMLGSEGDPWLDRMSQLRIMCHGAMYDVTWDHDNKPVDVPADRHNARLVDQSLAATAIGTTPMDAMITYCAARKAHPDSSGEVSRLEETILAIDSLLYARDDGVEDQRQAKDTVYTWSFQRSVGGAHFNFSGGDGESSGETQPVEPTRAAILKLRELNQTQSLLDSCTFSLQQLRWEMFSLWWKYISDVGNSGNDGNDGGDGDGEGRSDDYPQKAKDLSDHIAGLEDRVQKLQAHIEELLNPNPLTGENLLATAKPASKPVFYRNNDPTVLVGGIESGWPSDYLDKVSVRGPFQTIPLKNGASDLPAGLSDIVKQFVKLPGVLEQPAENLVMEFYALRPDGGDSGTAPEGKFYPQFHDKKTVDDRWRDQWGDRQPWFPLYMEWEVEYHHVPFEYWKLDEHTARLSSNPLVRYGITVPSEDGEPPLPLWEALPKDQGDKGSDLRILSGRVLILPQPSFSLSAKVTQLFDNTPEKILNQYISADDRKFLRDNINKLSYLSSPLSGFTEGILTQAQGSHIKPENVTVGPQGETSQAIEAAVVDAAGLTKERIEMIQGRSALTPYATLANFKEDKYSPFKPATHGQFRFRKLNIIDKFGQALQAIDQNPRVEGPPPIYPCISDFYEPQTVSVDGKEYANTVIQDTSDQCEFLQLPPKINQNARLNASFVMRVADDPADIRPTDSRAKWRPATEWENPIWGWLITNYADYGIQLFLPDGTFYREVRLGGPLGALKSPKWLPFAPDSTGPTPQTRQLDALAEKLGDKDYLQGFWNMILRAQANLAAAPTSYAQFLNSIVGKPLALVNMGWSLELDRPPLANQSTLVAVPDPERQLLPSSDPDDPKPYYEFQVRLGNKDAEYDGLVGYFDTTTPTSDELDLAAVKTFFVPDSGTEAPLEGLGTDNYPIFTSFFEPPFPTEPPYDGTGPQPIVPPEVFEDRVNSHLSVFGAIIDVFTPVQAYSSFLPPVSLSLPPWTWQKAMNTMTAFFHAGPITMPLQDVPDYDPNQLLTSKNARDMPKRELPLPGLGPGDWSWFQPYAVDDALRAAAGEDDPTAAKFNPFGIAKRGNLLKPGFQDGPYAAIEGFVQLRNPIMMPRPDPPAA